MNHGSLFSGIGGFDLAAEWMGWNNVFHCEIAEFPRKVLKYHFPNAISYDDITTTDFTIHRGNIDILTGGFPCQPFSLAGKRKGTEDERHLWPEMLRAIREINPTWVVGENVFGLVNWDGGVVFEQVQADLEAEGYEVQPYVLPACAVNAPHRRDRVWFVAHADKIQREPLGKRGIQTIQQQPEEIRRTHWSKFELVGNGNVPTEWRSERTGNISKPIICRGVNGIPSWVDRYSVMGNAIVPAVAFQIFKAIQQYEARLTIFLTSRNWSVSPEG